MYSVKNVHHGLVSKALRTRNMILRNEVVVINPNKGKLCFKANEDYFKAFKEWIFSGSKTKSSKLEKFSDKSKEYDVDFNGRNMAYGPRIAKQLGSVLEKLRTDKDTRQAYINILEGDDNIVTGLNELGKKVEYPCTIGYLFYIEDDTINMTTTMRSNNLLVVFPLDVYLSISLLEYVADKLGMRMGTYTHITLNGHILPHEKDRAEKFLNDFIHG